MSDKDVMRRKPWKPLTDQQKVLVDKVKALGEALDDALVELPNDYDKRMIALARTNIEQGVMWAVKGITA